MNHRMGHVEFTRPMWFQIWPREEEFNIEKMVLSYWLHVMQATQTNNEGRASRLFLEGTQLSFTLNVSSTCQIAASPPEPSVSTYK